MLLDIESLKLSLRIDGNADDVLLTGYSKAAEAYIKNAVGTDDDSFFEKESVIDLVKTAIIAQASAYYSFRTSLSLVESYPIEPAVDSIVAQLRGVYARHMEDKTDGN